MLQRKANCTHVYNSHMKDLTEAELIEIEQRADRLAAYGDDLSEAVAQDVATLLEHLRAVSIESQKMENAASRDAA